MPNKSQFKTQEKYLEWYRAYREKNREIFRKSNRRYMSNWRKENKEFNKYPYKEEIRKITRKAIAKGDITKQPCKICGVLKVEAHHEDYTKPFEVTWLCRLHHNQYHKGLIDLST